MSTAVPPDVAWVVSEEESAVLLARVPDHQPLRLEGSGAHLWLCWSDGLTLDESVAEMVQSYDVPEERVRPLAAELFRSLVRQGCLVPDPADRDVLDA